MKYTKTMACLGLMATFGTAQAAVIWDGPIDGTGDIHNAVNWSGDTLPETGVETGTITDASVRFSNQTVTPMAITFEGNTVLKNNQNLAVRIGISNWTFTDTSSFNMTGANGSNDNLIWGRNPSEGNSNLIWNSSGTLSGLGALRLGYSNASVTNIGYITQNAGTFQIDTDLTIKEGSVFTMSGGILNADVLLFDSTGEKLNFVTSGTGGVMNFANGGVDYTSTLEGYITAGNIQLNGGSSTIGDFDISYSGGITSISIVPEPSSAALLGLGGLAMILRRRK